ncbi:hypothetical protein [Synechococcus sp. LA31]|uniref:hypothetical protein n=1 Tax=Synechococcus sp. LA31 TaxID=2741953 RepID=UPI001BDD3BDB|nr:hypothetical protein [Synechococcus sp. LA31]QVV68721.1 hypothetical protein KJJ24_06295 [Synechococcus sp. LA31]
MNLALWQPLDAEQVGVAAFVIASGVRLGGWPADLPRSSSWPVAGDPATPGRWSFVVR